MASHHEVNDLLETIRKELPGRAHDAYEQAVKKAMQQRKHHRGGRGFDWTMVLPPMMQQRKQSTSEGLMPMLTLLIGFIGGAALMYLFDPDRGNRRRAAIQVEVRKVTTSVSDAVEETAERVETEINRVVNKAEDTAEEVGEKAKATANNAADSVKDTAAKVGDQVEDAAKQARNTAGDTAASVKSTAAKFGDQVEDAAKQARNTADKIVDKADSALDDAARKTRSAAADVKTTPGTAGE